jgi:hypothetical protein
VVVSASYKTDIPTFYSAWFANRLRAGYCKVVHPFNRKLHRTVSLRREDIDGFVFWTKNAGPFLTCLDQVHEQGLPFVVQYTINAYPRVLESSVVDSHRSIAHVRTIADRFGPKAAVWRYDTIVFSSETPEEFHLENFARLAAELEGTTDEAVISFVQLYRKTLRNMDEAARERDLRWEDPPDEVKCRLVARLVEIAGGRGMGLSVCAQPQYVVHGAKASRCVDADRLSAVANRTLHVPIRGNREGCGCCASVDIGEYDTCPHGCIYCYAVQNRPTALRRYREHDPEGEYLFTPPDASQRRADEMQQLPLFDDEGEH